MQLQEIGNHKTSVFTDNNDNYTKVVYHQTVVVAFNYQEIILNTGGWRTVTTKARMNQTSNQFNLRYRVFQKDFDWFVEYKDTVIPFDESQLVITR